MSSCNCSYTYNPFFPYSLFSYKSVSVVNLAMDPLLFTLQTSSSSTGISLTRALILLKLSLSPVAQSDILDTI